MTELWLSPSEYRDTINLRHVLSHNSGLGHLTLDRDRVFPPGQGYSYSTVGFLYLQSVIEEVTGQSYEEVAQEMVFAPLGMSSSSFVNYGEITSRTANGHVRAFVPALLFAEKRPIIRCLAVSHSLSRWTDSRFALSFSLRERCTKTQSHHGFSFISVSNISSIDIHKI